MLFRLPAYFQQSVEAENIPAEMPQYPFPKSTPAFGDDLKIGRVVQARLKYAVDNYYVDSNDDKRVHQLLVTGLWRRNGRIEKIECLRHTVSDRLKTYPDDFRLDTLQRQDGMRMPFGGTLMTMDCYILDNTEANFPSFGNREPKRIDPLMWPEILVRRAFSIVYNPVAKVQGNFDGLEELEREGFDFGKIPFTAVRNKVFVPEIQAETKTVDILPQNLVDDIVRYSVDVTTKRLRQFGNTRFAFPPMEEWKLGAVAQSFPHWPEEMCETSRPRQVGGIVGPAKHGRHI